MSTKVDSKSIPGLTEHARIDRGGQTEIVVRFLCGGRIRSLVTSAPSRKEDVEEAEATLIERANEIIAEQRNRVMGASLK